ncbi:transcriptional regulator [Actinoplanes sp. SE50]|uniref:anti-sigma factor RsbA family regulatory protein n=1 Tax=unclassified Actinoplanes TaxID=2626549 RepID=UPI00023ECB2D|nr:MULTISPECIES: anti-sigma factor RsbA family regulatory protein [unclassified Actinoplanes]AEV84790.1 putative anti-sigma regulatory factor, serine/threonine protein kinase [Actinoplanes sp. SE50/110]ATO83182.1 transcriptional regulator [Actinoplanes sp. SE50]SLM00589.1 anti-sigma regulatory factor, serine/threonine protein kinase [Actinoplanes sp. SE50/110]
MRSGAAAGYSGYFHESAFYDSDERFLAVIVPFFTEGLAAGEPVLAAFDAGRQELVREAFGPRSGIRFLDGATQYRRPAGAIRRYREIFGEYVAGGAAQIRVAGDVPQPANGAPWDWWARYEAAVNRAYQDFPVWGICPYDTRTTPPEVVAEVRRTHPHVVAGGGHAANPDFEDPAEFLRARAGSWRDPLERRPPDLELTDPTTPQARAAVRAVAAPTRLRAEDLDNLLLAVTEAVTNAMLHGRPPVVLRVWAAPRRLVATVTDAGTGPPDPYIGLLPADRAVGNGGLGLWMSHQVCSFVGMHRGPEGFTLRLVAGDLD